LATTGFVEIRDYVIWIAHIHSNQIVKNTLHDLHEGQLIELCVDGVDGVWKKMKDGEDGRETPGIKPIGVARKHWHELRSRRYQVVTLQMNRSNQRFLLK